MSQEEQHPAAAGDSVDRFDSLFYSKSDEKFTVRALLEEIFADRKFNLTLDIGPGPGHVSEPLARRSKSITMIEKSAKYKELLLQRFENARVLIAPVSEVELDARYDVILLSHVLYYQPQDTWLTLIQNLSAKLAPGGELIILLNADMGDWWKIVGNYWDELRPSIGFDYVPLSTFRKQLAQLGPIKSHPYRYQMWIDPTTDWGEFIAKQILELSDDDVARSHHARFKDFTKPFKAVDGSIVLDMRAEIIRLPALP